MRGASTAAWAALMCCVCTRHMPLKPRAAGAGLILMFEHAQHVFEHVQHTFEYMQHLHLTVCNLWVL